MRLHLFLSVEYGVGVAQQLFITTLNLKRRSMRLDQKSLSCEYWNDLRWCDAPVAEAFGLDADENLRADLRCVDDVRSVFGVQELWVLGNICFFFPVYLMKIKNSLTHFVPVYSYLTLTSIITLWKSVQPETEQLLTVNTFIDNCDLKVPKLPLLT